jgi:hypothetical protein
MKKISQLQSSNERNASTEPVGTLRESLGTIGAEFGNHCYRGQHWLSSRPVHTGCVLNLTSDGTKLGYCKRGLLRLPQSLQVNIVIAV